MKKILALLCAVFILFGTVPASAYAAGTVYESIEIGQTIGFQVDKRMDTVGFKVYDTSNGGRTDITSAFNMKVTYYYGAFGMIALEEEFRRSPDYTKKYRYDYGEGPTMSNVYFFALSDSEMSYWTYSENLSSYRYLAKIELTPKSGSFSGALTVNGSTLDGITGNTAVIYTDIKQSEERIEALEITASPKGDKVVTITAPKLESGYEYFYSRKSYVAYEGTVIGVNKTPTTCTAFGAGKNTTDVTIDKWYDYSIYKVKAGSSPSDPQNFTAYGFISLRPTGLVWKTTASEIGKDFFLGSGYDALIGQFTFFNPDVRYYNDAECLSPVQYHKAVPGSTIYLKLIYTDMNEFKNGEYKAADFGFEADGVRYTAESVTVQDGNITCVVPYIVPEKEDTGKHKVTVVDLSEKFTIPDNGKEYEAGETVFIYVESDPEYMIGECIYVGEWIETCFGNDYVGIIAMPTFDVTIYINAREGDYVVFETEDGTVLQGKTYIGKGLELPSFTTADGKTVVGWKCKAPFGDTVFDFGIGETFMSMVEGSSTPTEFKLIAVLGEAQCDHDALEWKVADEPDQYGFEVHYRKCPYCDFEESHSATNMLTPVDATHHKSVCWECGLTKEESCNFDHEYCEHIDTKYHSCGTECWCGNKMEDHKEEHINLQILPAITDPGKALYNCDKCGMFMADALEARGDVNGDGNVNSADAIYLLRHTMRADRYPINQSGDMNSDGSVNSADAIYLLRYIMRPERYPLAPDKKTETK